MADIIKTCAMIDAQHDAMLSLWEKLVNIDCEPGCKEGVDTIAGWKIFCSHLVLQHGRLFMKMRAIRWLLNGAI